MKISVYGYNSFKAVIDAISTPTNVFYKQSSGTVTDALALLSGGVYVQSVDVNNTAANFLAEYPSAVQVSVLLKGEY